MPAVHGKFCLGLGGRCRKLGWQADGLPKRFRPVTYPKTEAWIRTVQMAIQMRSDMIRELIARRFGSVDDLVVEWEERVRTGHQRTDQLLRHRFGPHRGRREPG